MEGGKNHKEVFARDGYFIILDVVMASCVHTHAKTRQIVQFQCVPFTLHQ